MMKHTFPLVFVLLLILGARMFAGLGNSEDQIADLYGKPNNQGFPDKNGITTNMYQKGDYIVLVQFLQRLSLAESYTRVDQHEFSEKELFALLEKSSNGRQWIKDPNKFEWERSDHKARAWSATVRGRPTLLIQAE
jgi:hypothetical protein